MSRRGRFIIPVTIILVATAAYVLGWSSIFTVKKVIVVGSPNSAEAIAIEKNVHVGQKMARLESHSITNSLKKYSWLDHASVSRNWISGVVMIRLSTRIPSAQYQGHLVDTNGVIFDLASVNESQLTNISGPNISSVKFATDLLRQLPNHLRTAVSAVDIRGAEMAILTLADPTLHRTLKVVWGDLTNIALKVKVYQALLALPENRKITTVDVSAPHAPIVR